MKQDDDKHLIAPPILVFLNAAICPVALFLSFNLPDLAREIEALIALGVGAAFTISTIFFARLTATIEDPLTAIARQAQSRGTEEVDPRTLELVHAARQRVRRMVQLSEARAIEFQQSVAQFADIMECLFNDILTNPDIRHRADNLLRRTLPRLEEAVATYVEYAERGTDLIDPAEMRARVIEALNNTSEQAERVRIDAIAGVENNVEIALDVLESSFAYEQR